MKTLKRIIALSIVAMVFGACSNDFESGDMRNTVKLRSQEEAISIAVSAHNTFFSNDTRAANTVAIAEGGVHVVKGRSSRGLSNDTLLYVVNYEDNRGFALVSASPTTTPLVGIAEEGNYTPGQSEENSNLQYYLDNVCESIGYSMSSGTSVTFPPGPIGPNLPPRDSIPLATLYTVLSSKGPFVDLKWGQGEPYGNLYPNGKCSSFPVVVGMIATEFWKPSHGRSGGIYIDWEELSQHKGGESGCHESSLSETHNAISELMADIKNRHSLIQCEDSVVFEYQSEVLTDELVYNHQVLLSYQLDDTDDVISVIDNYAPSYYNQQLVFAVEKKPEGDPFGHESIEYCWLIDGYKTIVYCPPALNPSSQPEEPAQPITYFHCNWANDGNGNGYFLPTSYFNSVLHYDSSIHSFSLEFNNPITYHAAIAATIVGM